MSDGSADLSIDQLAERSGVPARTIRYYISEGLLPGAGARGRGAAYTEEHLLRLRLVRRLAERRVPLAEIRAQLARLSPDDIQALLAREDRLAASTTTASTPKEFVARLLERASADYSVDAEVRSPPSLASRTRAPAAPAPSAPADTAAGAQPDTSPPPAAAKPLESWRRVELAPGVELHVRADAERRHRRLIERVVALVTRHARPDE